MYKPSIEQLKKVLETKGYPFLTNEWELNIIGIRKDNATPNAFDFLFGKAYSILSAHPA